MSDSEVHETRSFYRRAERCVCAHGSAGSEGRKGEKRLPDRARREKDFCGNGGFHVLRRRPVCARHGRWVLLGFDARCERRGLRFSGALTKVRSVRGGATPVGGALPAFSPPQIKRWGDAQPTNCRNGGFRYRSTHPTLLSQSTIWNNCRTFQITCMRHFIGRNSHFMCGHVSCHCCFHGRPFSSCLDGGRSGERRTLSQVRNAWGE
jgi:hypothetical protein